MIKSIKTILAQDKEKFKVPKKVQDFIPIKCVWPDGIFKVGNKFSKTYKFSDINYLVASREDKESMFLTYSELLNSLDSGATTKITINNHRLNKADFEDSILKSIIDRCITNVYRNAADAGTIPTLCTLRDMLLEQPEPEAKQIALSLELYTTGSLDIFGKQSNVDLDKRIVVFDIHGLGSQLKPTGLLVITDTMLNRVTLNWKKGKRTHVFIDEFHVVFENEFSAQFFNSAWRQFRKRNAYPTAITQNVEYLLDSVQASTMLSNSEFVIMLNQAASDREKLARLLNISNEQMSYITNADAGCGLIKYGSALVPFINQFPHETKLYQLMMLSFITVMGIFDHIIYKLDGKLSLARKDELTREINSLMSAKDKNKGVTVRYDKLIELLKENNYAFLFKIIDYFNIFNDDGKLKTYLPASFTLFSEKETFYSITNDYKFGMEYEKKAKAFAYIDYLSNNPSPNPDHLEAWMHFVCNVCSNSYNLANYTDTFCTSIAGLHYLCCEDIVSEIAQKDLSVLATLDIPQIEEEILKMKLSSNPSWGNAIDNAEKDLSYFEGRLRYPLIECCGVDENDIADIQKIALFIDYVEKIASIFINASGCPFESELIRAMLSKGDYLMYFNSNNTLLKNADRDNSWRRFLKEKASDNNAYHPYGMVSCDLRDYFRSVIDDPLFDKSNAKSSLLAIAQARDSSIPMWRKLIIDCADILNNTEVNALGKDRFLRWNNETTQYPHKKDSEDNYEIDLIPGSAITGYHAELFSLCKYYELKGKTFGALGSVIYQRAKTNIEQPYFYLGNEDEPIVKVMYQDDCCFRFLMADGTEECNIAFDDVEARLLAINP